MNQTLLSSAEFSGQSCCHLHGNQSSKQRIWPSFSNRVILGRLGISSNSQKVQTKQNLLMSSSLLTNSSYRGFCLIAAAVNLMSFKQNFKLKGFLFTVFNKHHSIIKRLIFYFKMNKTCRLCLKCPLLNTNLPLSLSPAAAVLSSSHKQTGSSL